MYYFIRHWRLPAQRMQSSKIGILDITYAPLFEPQSPKQRRNCESNSTSILRIYTRLQRHFHHSTFAFLTKFVNSFHADLYVVHYPFLLISLQTARLANINTSRSRLFLTVFLQDSFLASAFSKILSHKWTK